MEIQVSEIQVQYKSKTKKEDRFKVSSSKDAYKVLKHIWDDDLELLESFYCLILNRANEVIGYKVISKGGLSGTMVDPKIVFKASLVQNGSSMIIAHNHPSGNLTLSLADKKITEKLVDAGKVLETPILDHIIITDDSYFSFSDNGLI